MFTTRQLNQLKAYFKRQPDVVAAYLFGSQATGRSSRPEPRRDIDIAVLFKGNLDDSQRFDKTLKFMSRVSSAIKKKTDVIDLNSAPNLLKMNTIMGKLIYSANDPIRVGFEVETLRDYHDNEYADRLERQIRFQQIEQENYESNYL